MAIPLVSPLTVIHAVGPRLPASIDVTSTVTRDTHLLREKICASSRGISRCEVRDGPRDIFWRGVRPVTVLKNIVYRRQKDTVEIERKLKC